MFEEDDDVLSEIEESRHKKTLAKTVNKKKLSAYELDELFMEG